MVNVKLFTKKEERISNIGPICNSNAPLLTWNATSDVIDLESVLSSFAGTVRVRLVADDLDARILSVRVQAALFLNRTVLWLVVSRHICQ